MTLNGVASVTPFFMRADREAAHSGKALGIPRLDCPIDEFVQTIARARQHDHPVDIGLAS
jgi:hypothetical protein